MDKAVHQVALCKAETVAAPPPDVSDDPDLPVYDVDGNCRKAFTRQDPNSPSTPEQSRLGCIQIEQQAYDSLRAIWGGLLPETKRKAIAYPNRISGPKTYRYSNLEG
jgi:hypothetical protein